MRLFFRLVLPLPFFNLLFSLFNGEECIGHHKVPSQQGVRCDTVDVRRSKTNTFKIELILLRSNSITILFLFFKM